MMINVKLAILLSCLLVNTVFVHGKVTFNEIMINPRNTASNPNTNWVELYNTGSENVFLFGWLFRVCQPNLECADFPLNQDVNLMIGANGYLVIGNNGDVATNGGVVVDIVLPFRPFPSNGKGKNTLQLKKPTDGPFGSTDNVFWNTENAEFPHYPLPFVAGASLGKISPLEAFSTDKNWKPSETFINCVSGALGTPGKINTYRCPPPTAAPVIADPGAVTRAPQAPTRAPATSPTVRPPCGLLSLSIFCLNGCGVFGRIIGLCS